MAEFERYIQPALPTPDPERSSRGSPQQSYLDTLFDEYWLECDSRREHDLPFVTLQEFAQMRELSRRAEKDALYDDPTTSPEALGDAKASETVIFGKDSVPPAETRVDDPIMERLQRGVEAAMSAEGFKAFLQTQAKFHNYSPYNAMLIASQMPEATRVAGYRKWQEMGRQVRKGEKGIVILAPKTRTFEDEETGEKLITLTGFRDVKVFALEQTDGPDLPEPPRPTHLEGNDPIGDELYSRLTDFVTAAGVDVVKGPLYRDGKELNGAWSPSHRAIVINHHLAGDQEVKTFTHEVAHMVADHRDRVGIHDKETVAESAAYVTLMHFGLDTSAYTFPYVTGWAQHPEVFKRNIDEIQKISNLLITKIGDGCPPAED